MIRVALVGEQDSIAPRQEFWVDVQFDLDKGLAYPLDHNPKVRVLQCRNH